MPLFRTRFPHYYTASRAAAVSEKDGVNRENVVTCCSDGTRPVIFKIERLYEE